mmetsp:Transcript_86440/g.180978  ORF Transcript_86440/g.180978 Transcript_86440/m.180978 type:complete len:219 (-) Transcript_86440:2911-3567(-)
MFHDGPDVAAKDFRFGSAEGGISRMGIGLWNRNLLLNGSGGQGEPRLAALEALQSQAIGVGVLAAIRVGIEATPLLILINHSSGSWHFGHRSRSQGEPRLPSLEGLESLSLRVRVLLRAGIGVVRTAPLLRLGVDRSRGDLHNLHRYWSSHGEPRLAAVVALESLALSLGLIKDVRVRVTTGPLLLRIVDQGFLRATRAGFLIGVIESLLNEVEIVLN